MKLNSRRRYKAWLRAVLQREDLSREDILKIIRGQLALPAREIDGGLLKECFAELDTPEGGTISGHEEEIWARIRLKIGNWEYGWKAWLASHGRRRMIVLALTGLLLLMLAAAAIAAAFGYRIFGFPFPADHPSSYVQEGAYELTHHSLAHFSFTHVDVDILEAVYDGKDLRVVYSVRDRNATELLTEKDLYRVMDAAVLDGVVSVCDWVEINGQSAYLSDAAEEPGGQPGEMVYSIEALLSDQGIQPEGVFTVGIPIVRNGNKKFAPPELTFTLNAGDAKKWVRTAAPAEIDVGDIHIAMTEAEFSPMSGAILLIVTDTAYKLADGQGEWKPEDGDWAAAVQSPVEKEAYLWGGKAQLITKDGAQVGITDTEYWSYREGPGVLPTKLRVTPPQGEGWPEEMFLAVLDDSGKPDPLRRIPVILK